MQPPAAADLAARRSRPSQSETAIFPSEPGSGGRLRCIVTSSPAAFIHWVDGLGREAEPAMRMLLAQKFKIVRSEINDQQAPAGLEHARGFADRASAVVEEVQHLMDDDRIERIGRQCEIVDVALAHAAMLQARALDARARQRQHVERQIDAEAALDVGAEQFEHAPGAGAEIEQRAERLVGERIGDRAFDCGVGDVQLADAIPFGGVGAEIFLRGGCARLAHR